MISLKACCIQLIYTLDYELVILYNVFNIIILNLILVSSIRVKFLYFFLLLFTSAYWGFLFSFDGIIFILLLTELTLILVFILLFFKLSFQLTNTRISNYIILSFILVFNISFLSYFWVEYSLVYLAYYTYTTFYVFIITSDFFIFFYSLFFTLPYITTMLGALLGLFSIFFILIFFILKMYSVKQKYFKKQLFLLRKQNVIHQSIQLTILQTFQK